MIRGGPTPGIAVTESIRSLDEIPRGLRLCLYGAGEGGAHFLELLRAKRPDLAVVRFVDDERRGERGGVPIAPRRRAGAHGRDRPGAGHLLLVARDRRAARRAAAARGYRVVDPSLFFLEHVFTPEEQAAAAPLAARAEALLALPEDRALYRAVLANRGLGGHGGGVDPYRLFTEGAPPRAEYLDFIVWERVRRAIDGGALDGKNTLEFLDRMPPGGEVWAFEPGGGALRRDRTRRISPGAGRAPLPRGALEQFGVGSLPGGQRQPGRLEGSWRRGRLGGRPHGAGSLDRRFHGPIRGSTGSTSSSSTWKGPKPDVLAGARRTLAACRPQLAVCIYHRKEQLYTIPLQLADLLPGYVHRIGHYSPSFWDTVWYAIPAELLDGERDAP